MLKQSISLPLPVAEAQKKLPLQGGAFPYSRLLGVPWRSNLPLEGNGAMQNFAKYYCLKQTLNVLITSKRRLLKEKNKVTEILHLTFFQKKGSTNFL